MTTKGKNVIRTGSFCSIGHPWDIWWNLNGVSGLDSFYRPNCVSQIHESLATPPTLFPIWLYLEIEFLGDKVKVDHKGGVFIWQDWLFYTKTKSFLFLSVCSYTLKKPCEHMKAGIYKPGRRFSPETKLTNTLILDFQLPEQWENSFLLFKLPNLWYFVMAAWTNNGHNLTILISRFW